MFYIEHSQFLFLIHPDALLMQKRSKLKYHSPGLWTNTCCSHQRDGERTIDAANRRLNEEMGLNVD